MSELSFEQWYQQSQPFILRAEESLGREIDRFGGDWAGEYEFRIISTHVRTKSLPRIIEKCAVRALRPEELLHPPYPIQDLVGARLVVRSLRDAERLLVGIQENFPMSCSVEDKNKHPSPTGYRAIHLDGQVEESVKGICATIPFEIQIKTIAQQAWGEYTHDTAYARTTENTDARFQVVRQLQKALADHLDAADQLQFGIERLAEDALVAIASAPGGEAMTVENVMNAAYRELEVVLSLAEAQQIAETAKAMGKESISELGPAFDTSSPKAEDVADDFRREHSRTPRIAELIMLMLRLK